LIEIDNMLDQNAAIFEQYGPYSELALNDPFGDTQRAWRQRCLDTIIPNNDTIIRLIVKHKNAFGYPWDLYGAMLDFEVHAASFRENCLFESQVDGYKLFPRAFPNLIKAKLGIEVTPEEQHDTKEKIEYRYDTVAVYVNEFLSQHTSIASMEPVSRGVFITECNDGRRLRVFVTNTYFFTDYTYEKILIEDPNINVIICSNPYSQYTDSAKRRCAEDNIGLFKLGEFMGALNYQGERFLNYISRQEVGERIDHLSTVLKKNIPPGRNYEVYLFGSYLRSKLYNDIDIFVVYDSGIAASDVDVIVGQIKQALPTISGELHFQCVARDELHEIRLDFDNRVKLL